MSRKRLVLLLLALLVIVLSWWQVSVPRRGLAERSFTHDGVPLLYIVPEGMADAPGVLVAHGFSGSKQVMLGYAYTLAHAGYAVMLWDSPGHAANPLPLGSAADLQRDVDVAYAALVEQPEVDPARVAIIGHSMGSGVAMTAGIAAPERYAAVVAISPTSAAVTPELPRNLLLQAGSWEGGFVLNAERLLAAAGGGSADFAGGRARDLVVVPFAEHMSILLRPRSHHAALDWLNNVFGWSSIGFYADTRILWYGLHLLGWLGVVLAAAPLLRSRTRAGHLAPGWRRWLGLAMGVAAGVIAIALLDRAFSIARLGGLVVGGAVALWLLVVGMAWLLVQWPLLRPALRDLALGVVLFAALSLAFGVMAQRVWVQWWLIPPRLARWPLLAAACLPYFLAAGHAQAGADLARRGLWWLGQSVLVVGGLFVTLLLAPSLGFLVLLMPLFPLLLGIFAVTTVAFDRPWPYAIGTALFFGWVLAAVFPLA